MATPAIETTHCAHCTRKFDEYSNPTLVRVPVPLPTDHTKVIGYDHIYVCNPTRLYRPRCFKLVTSPYFKGHTVRCWVCIRNYPPGAELKAVPEEGRWALHDKWLAA